MKQLTHLALMLGLSVSLPAGTTAYWRLEEGVAGNAITAALDSSGNELNQNGKGGNPTYSSNVPGAFIYGSLVPRGGYCFCAVGGRA